MVTKVPRLEQTRGMSESKPQDEDDETRRRFREALERKHGERGAAAAPHEPGRPIAPHSNDKRQRTFRRKAGG